MQYQLPQAPRGPVARLFAAIAAIFATAAVVIVGFFAGILMLGLFVLAGAIIAFRVWQIRRAIRNAAAASGPHDADQNTGSVTIEGDFEIVERRTRRGDES